MNQVHNRIHGEKARSGYFFVWTGIVSDIRKKSRCGQKKATLVDPDDVVPCMNCGKPAKYLDIHFPYCIDQCRCEECFKAGK